MSAATCLILLLASSVFPLAAYASSPASLGPTKAEIAKAYTILESVYKQSAGTKYYARDAVSGELAPYDLKLSQKLAGGTSNEAVQLAAAANIASQAKADPSYARRLNAETIMAALSGIKDPATRRQIEGYVALGVAHANPALAKEFYHNLRSSTDLAKIAKGAANDPGPIFSLAFVAGLAAAVHDPEAPKLVDQAVLATKKAFTTQATSSPTGGASQQDQMLEVVAETVAQGSPTLALTAISQISDQQKPAGVARMIAQVAPYDLQAAEKLLTQIPTDSFYYGQAVVSLVNIQAATDPAGAAAIARTVPKNDWGSHRAIALATAATHMPGDLASPIFREALGDIDPTSQKAGTNMGWVASLAYQRNPELGKELFALAKDMLAAQASKSSLPLPSPGQSPPASDQTGFAFYYAQVDPAASRTLIEKAYTAADQSDWEKFHAALAMSAVDLDRALALARGIPDVNFRFDAQRKIAQYVLASADLKHTLRFDRWEATDTWRPGTPTGW